MVSDVTDVAEDKYTELRASETFTYNEHLWVFQCDGSIDFERENRKFLFSW